jgi:salicylate hydroxylase
LNEDPGAKQSWVAEGNLDKMLQTFSEFPTWVTSVFKYERLLFEDSPSVTDN